MKEKGLSQELICEAHKGGHNGIYLAHYFKISFPEVQTHDNELQYIYFESEKKYLSLLKENNCEKIIEYIQNKFRHYSTQDWFNNDLIELNCQHTINFYELKYQKLIDYLKFQIQDLTNKNKENDGVDIIIGTDFSGCDEKIKMYLSNYLEQIGLKYTNEERSGFLWEEFVLNIKGWTVI